MNYKFTLLVCLLGQMALCLTTVLGQDRYSLTGNVTDVKSDVGLVGVTIRVNELETGTATNNRGRYIIQLPAGQYTIEASYLGFEKITRKIELNADMQLDFQMAQQTSELDEVVVTGDLLNTDLSSKRMSVNSLSIETIQSIPMVLGEADIVKSLLLLPGVTNAGEASSGFNVRGGAVDQNLILLDEATIFNASHLFGFFSVFNPDAVKDIKLFKGGIPARYGGRVSSVLEIFQKEADTRQFHLNGGVGAVASRLTAEIPVVKERFSILAGGRSSYAHLFFPLFDIDNSAYFYDFNAKASYTLNARNELSLSGYTGKDVFDLNDNYNNTYGNTVANLHWNHLFSDRLSSDLSLIYSHYFSDLDIDFEGFKWRSAITNGELKYNLQQHLSDNVAINYGMDHTYFMFDPGLVKPNNPESGILEEQLTKKYALQSALYIDVQQDLFKRLQVGYGLRLSHFLRLGQDELNVYERNDPLFFDPFTLTYTANEPIAVSTPGRNGRLARFTNFEPRISVSYDISSVSVVKASYTRLAQYLHLISNTSSPTPLDVWAPSGPFIEPQLLDQYAIGVVKEFGDRSYSAEIELYHKSIDNRVDYIDGADLVAQNAVEQVILNGEARAKGIELLLQKKKGKLKGWLAYTLSTSEQRTPGRTPTFDNGRSNKETGINLGRWYKSPFDKTHDISLYVGYDVGSRWKINSNFVFQTGQPTNYPIGQFEFQDLTIPYYGFRNRERLPDYHRMDISISYQPLNNAGRKWKSEWVFSVYNIYNRQNAASINFRRNQDTDVNEAVRTSIFGVVPALTYNFNF